MIRFILFLCLISLCFISPAHAAIYTPDGDIVGEVGHYTVQKGDNFYKIARRFDLGIVELMAANPDTDPWLPEEGEELTLPTMHVLPPVREGIVLNLSALRLFYFTPDGRVLTFPIGIGRESWQTPPGTAMVTLKRQHPTWIPTDSIREQEPNLPDFVPPGPDNPLGDYALNISLPGIRIHGTNRPSGVGSRVSHGCIRLYPEDIKTLFAAVNIGTKVTIIDAPYQLGRRGDTLFLQVTPTQDQADAIMKDEEPQPVSEPEVVAAVENTAGVAADIRWYDVDNAVSRRDFIPVAITTRH